MKGAAWPIRVSCKAFGNEIFLGACRTACMSLGACWTDELSEADVAFLFLQSAHENVTDLLRLQKKTLVWFVLCGDAHCIPRSMSVKESDARSLSALRVQMSVKPILEHLGFDKSPPIPIGFVRRDNVSWGASKESEPISAISGKQLRLLSGDGHVMGQSETWQIFCSFANPLFLNEYSTRYEAAPFSVTNELDAFARTAECYQYSSVDEDVAERHTLYRVRLEDWVEKQIEKWDSGSDDYARLREKFFTREAFIQFLRRKAEKKFLFAVNRRR
eukprot:Stramenopile-MAST_4_protein_5823